MKVKDLEKGMLLECVNDNDFFYISKHGGPPAWLTIRTLHKRLHRKSKHLFSSEKIVMYVGTKKDTGIDHKWCDKFVLIESQVVGVDPGIWQRIKILDTHR